MSVDVPPNDGLQPDTQPRGAYLLAFPEVPWPRGCVPLKPALAVEGNEMKLYSYIVTHDTGFSPNPFWGYCTLADCKPAIRRTAEVGDWIVGLSPKPTGNRMVFAMQVDEILSYADYYHDERFTGFPRFCRQPGN